MLFAWNIISTVADASEEERKKGLVVWIMEILWIIRLTLTFVHLKVTRDCVEVALDISSVEAESNLFPIWSWTPFNLTHHFNSRCWCDDDKLRTFLLFGPHLHFNTNSSSELKIPSGFSLNLHNQSSRIFYALIRGNLKTTSRHRITVNAFV